MHPIITLTTDFGIKDPFIGIMKGVILNICPKATIVDLNNSIAPQNLLQTSYVLKTSVSYFPKNTIHVAVVDPEVGTNRKCLAIKTDKFFFVGPDNGIFSPFFKNFKAVELTNQDIFIKPISSTFHGRDIFAPTAAWLAKGKSFEKLGKILKKPVTLDFPKPKFIGGCLKGEIIHRDHFGNLISNISKGLISKYLGDNFINIKAYLKDQRAIPLVSNYTFGFRNSPAALINSWEQVEVFCKEGNASKVFKILVGDSIQISRNQKR